jgi:hypothetical protein
VRQERENMPTPEETKAAQEAEAAAQAAAAAQEQKPEKPPTQQTQSREQVLEAELKRARAEAAQYRTKARSEAEAKKKAEEEALAKSGQFKELAEQREKRAKELETELETSRAKLSTYEQREAEEQAKREAQVAADFDALPDDIRADIPADADLRTKQIAISTYRKAKGTAAPAAAAPRPPSIPSTAPKPAALTPPAEVSRDDVAKAARVLGNPKSAPAERKAAQVVIDQARAKRA